MAEIKPMYRMSINGSPIFRLRWDHMERAGGKDCYNPNDETSLTPEEKLIRAFALEQQDHYDPDMEWMIRVNFIEVGVLLPAPIEEYNVHVFPEAIPLPCVMGRHQGDIIEFDLDQRKDLTVRVICDQTSSIGYCAGKYDDDDPAYKIDPFVSKVENAMYQRLCCPYKNIDFKAEDERELRLRKAETERLQKMFESVQTHHPIVSE